MRKPIFRTTDVDFKLSGVGGVQLSRWVNMGYLAQVRRGLYVFSDKKDSIDPLMVSFLLYEPSYVSMESALSYYGLIPELVPVTTAISTRKTMAFENAYGAFSYRNIRQELFFGYVPREIAGGKFLMAEPEKAVLDYIYFNHMRLISMDDIDGLRLNTEEFSKTVNAAKLKEYAKAYDSEKITDIIDLILQHVNA
jgi:predicted transcriptional regulator of viral defense system